MHLIGNFSLYLLVATFVRLSAVSAFIFFLICPEHKILIVLKLINKKWTTEVK